MQDRNKERLQKLENQQRRSLQFLGYVYDLTGGNSRHRALLSDVFTRWREKWPNDTHREIIGEVSDLWHRKLIRMYVSKKKVLYASDLLSLIDMDLELVVGIYFHITPKGKKLIEG